MRIAFFITNIYKHIVFTGKLERTTRQEAMQKVVNLGGILDSNVIKPTNYLIRGNNDYNAILKGRSRQSIKKLKSLS